MGEVWLKVHGNNGERSTLKLKHVLYVRSLLTNIVSGEHFYRKGGRVDGNKVIDSNGRIIIYINVERRGFFPRL